MLILYNRLDETTEYAVSELSRYVSQMTGGAVRPVSRHLETMPLTEQDGCIRLGLLEDLGLPAEEGIDPVLDDVLDIAVTGGTGHIGGSNIRSVLLGVYRYLRSAGARWVRPGPEGEVIPLCDLTKHSFTYRHKAESRFRGECIEGAISYENVADTIVWSPKVGLNMFFLEQIVPFNYISRWYKRAYNDRKQPDERTFETVADYTRRLEMLTRKCGLQLHSMGHGYMFEPYGIHYHTGSDHYDLSDEAVAHSALVGGKRGLFHGSPNFTHLCYSNPDARRNMVNFCADYLQRKPEIDFLHVWLADANNNHCECENCQKKTPSDWYVILLNELDDELTRRGMSSRIVFILYNETVFPPVTEKLHDTDRFILLTAFSRSYSEPYTDEPYDGELPKFIRNHYNVPVDFRVKYTFYKEWRKQFSGSAFLYEYYFYSDHYNDPGYTALCPILHEDARRLKALGFDGIVSDQTQRSFFPTGLPMSVMSEALFDPDFDEEAFTADFYTATYGEDGAKVRPLLEKLSALFDPPLLRSRRPIVEQDTGIGRTADVWEWQHNPAYAAAMEKVPAVADEMRALAAAHVGTFGSDLTRDRSWRYLALHADYVALFSEMMKKGAEGDRDAMRDAYGVMMDRIKDDEDLWQGDFDPCLLMHNLQAKLR